VKRKTFYQLSLVLPYIALLITGGLTYLTNDPEAFSIPWLPNLLSGLAMFFTFSAVIWGPLYTWLVAVMLFWGKGKTMDEIHRLYLLSPVLLGCSMGFPALLISIPEGGYFLLWGALRISNLDFLIPIFFQYDYMEQAFGVGLAWALMAALCIVIGYAFVGVALLLERAMKRQGLLRDEGAETAVPGVALAVSPVSGAE
jgi:hypothetical protein